MSRQVLIIASDPRHAYMRKLKRMFERGLIKVMPETLNDIVIMHDEWCHIFKGKICNCDPDVGPIVSRDKTKE